MAMPPAAAELAHHEAHGRGGHEADVVHLAARAFESGKREVAHHVPRQAAVAAQHHRPTLDERRECEHVPQKFLRHEAVPHDAADARDTDHRLRHDALTNLSRRVILGPTQGGLHCKHKPEEWAWHDTPGHPAIVVRTGEVLWKCSTPSVSDQGVPETVGEGAERPLPAEPNPNIKNLRVLNNSSIPSQPGYGAKMPASPAWRVARHLEMTCFSPGGLTNAQ